MDRFKPPTEFNFEGNIGNKWKAWKKSFNFYMTASEADGKDDKVKTSILLTCIGDRGREIYETFEFADNDDKLKLDPVLENFDSYCNPRANITIARHQFFTYRQCEGQSFTNFVTELKKLAMDCGFETLKDSLIKDMIICGVADNALRERMLREPAIDLKKAVELGQAAEETKLHVKQIENHQQVSVDRISNYSRGRGRSYDASKVTDCKYCGGTHPRRKCPAYGKSCKRCQRKNHFTQCCLSKVDLVKENNSSKGCNQVSSSEDEFYIDTIDVKISEDLSACTKDVKKVDSMDHQNNLDWSILLETNGEPVKYKMDTGAQANILPKQVYDTLHPRPRLKKSTIKLAAYNDTDIPVLGKCISTIHHKGKVHHILFIVVNSNTAPILGLNSCERLNLIQRVQKVKANPPMSIEENFEDCFGEIGTLDATYHIELKDNIKPVVIPTRKVPFGLKHKLKEELDRMVSLEVIEKVEKATDWMNALVIVEKPNGKLRVCLDPRPLNKAIKRQYHKLPTAEEIISNMTGARYFSKLDASSGFWQIKVDEASSDLLTFGTPFARYKFKRLPYGVHSASEIFQVEIAKIIENIEGAFNMQDDIVVWGDSKETHDKRLTEVLTQIRKSGLKLNRTKCVFGATELTFLGHIISAEGVKPDPEKIKAITSMPVPSNKQELQRFLGMVNYVGKFIANLSQETAPLRVLLKKENEFIMEKAQLNAISKLKSMITSAPILKFYDPNLPTRIRTDSSSEGLGAMIEQNHGEQWFPIAYASRALNNSERNYAQIEKETLSIVFGCERFHEYVYGREFIVQNDHQPLKAILSKTITECPPRIQRFFLRLQKYNFSFEYSPGKTMVVADALSRAFLKDCQSEIQQPDLIHYIQTVFEHIPISKRRLKQLQEESNKDDVMRKLKDYTYNGWPVKKNVDIRLMPFYKHRHEISVCYDLLLKGQRIIIPPSMRKEMKSIIHQGHQGMVNSKARARDSVYWPGISQQINDMVSDCSECSDYQNRQQKESLIEHQVPEAPWVKLAADIFTIYKKDYLLVVDYNSKFFEIASLNTPADSSDVINAMKKIFSRHGLPHELFSDNGTQFTSKEFATFTKEWDFDHNTSDPHFPQSNGLVERKIQTVKKTLKKAFKSGGDIYLALLALNATPGSDGISPAKRLYNRQPRTTLPSVLPYKTNPRTVNPQVKTRYDAHAKDLKTILPGTAVRLRTDKDPDWTQKGRVIEYSSKPRSYSVLNNKGNVVHRNRRHIIPTNEEFQQFSNYEETIPVETPAMQGNTDSSVNVDEPLLIVSNGPIPTEATQASKESALSTVPTRTRSGRQINRPSRFNDYTT